MRIIETVEEFETFLSDIKGHDCILIPTYCNGNKPVHADSLSVLYVYTLLQDQEALLIFNHTEGNQIPEQLLQKFPEDVNLFVYGKKRFKKFLDRINVIDIDLIEYFHNNRCIEEDFETTAHEFFIRNFQNYNDLNTIIPVVKHIEKAQAIVSRFFNVYDYFVNDYSFQQYNNLILDSLYKIEQNGLFTNSKLNKTFPGSIHYNQLLYSEYNLYTTTGRPSNRFGKINFAALNKETGQRAVFSSRFGKNGFLMSFDYDAYHLRLLAELIDYKFPDNCSVHEYLGKYYFSKTELTEAEYQEAKSISFRQLYGGIGDSYITIPFFEKVHEYTQLLWKSFQSDGYIETPMFSRKLFRSFFTDMNAAKLLNYVLQSFETERNMAVIHNILHRIQSYKSKLILYTYDSFLFDFNTIDAAEFIYVVKEELEQNGKFPVKIEVGPDYHNMQSIKLPN